MLRRNAPREPLLASRFRFSGPLLLCPRARLFSDRIELTGWHMRGRYRQEIALSRILQADIYCGCDLLLWFSDGKTLRLHLRQAQRWKEVIDERGGEKASTTR